MYRRTFLAAVATLAASSAWSMSGMHPAREKAPPGTPPTQSAETEAWFESLRSYNGNPCCGQGDAYPVRIDVEPPPDSTELLGHATVLDGSARRMVLQNGDIIQTAPVNPNRMQFLFPGRILVKEKYGNPLKTAIAFLRVDTGGNISFVFCVVPLPPGS